MNIFSSSKKVCAGAVLALACAANAQTFSYNNGDILVGFRLSSGGNNDLVVNAGTAAPKYSYKSALGSSYNWGKSQPLRIQKMA